MRTSRLVTRAFVYYRRTNAAVVLGVATAVAVLGGALLVGDSVRGSLRDLVLHRLGRTDAVVTSTGFFREALAGDLRADASFPGVVDSMAPLIVLEGGVGDQASGRRASRVAVYGVDDRFWRFHGVNVAGWDQAASRREAIVSEALAAEIGASPGGAVLVRVSRPSAIPIESLQGRKDDVGRTLRLTVRAVAGPAELGEFSLRPQQGRVRAVFVPLQRLQQELEVAGRVNTLLVARAVSSATSTTARASLEDLVRRAAALDDLGLTLRLIEPTHTIAIESAAGVLNAAQANAAERAAGAIGHQAQVVFTYLAMTLRLHDRDVPYSLVTAIDANTMAGVGAAADERPPIVLNDWAARDLAARVGDPLTLEYAVWEEPGRIVPRSADFRVAAVVPIQGVAADRSLAPVYPGLTDSDTIADWDPPFPIDLRRVRPIDEDYWRKFRTTPKAFVPLEVGQRLWRSRYGDRTSVRISVPADQPLESVRDRYAAQLRAILDPLALGLSVSDVRANGLAASRGSTDFGEYFTYFSFFLVISALLLAALFFRLGVEQRAREVGLLRAVGYTTGRIRRLFAAEGLVVTAVGSGVGIAGAIGYALVMMTGLGSWWSGAVGTDALRLHVSAAPLAGAVIGVPVTAMVCLWWTLRGLARLSERSLLAGTVADASGVDGKSRSRSPLLGALLFGTGGLALMVASAAHAIDKAGAFFGAGSALLVACLCLVAVWLRRPVRRSLDGRGWWSMVRLGERHAADRPGRSVLVVAVIASATFILISVDAFRRVSLPSGDRRSGVGGYSVLVELLFPLAHDPNGREGREALGLTAFPDVRIEPFRVRPGDDASCLNLYEPKNPTILGAKQAFIESGRFTFQAAIPGSDRERGNPWLLLNRTLAGDQGPIVPVITDANSMTYVLHKNLGDDIVIDRGGRPVRLRLVAALGDSILQSELVMSDANFLELFPDQQGYQFLLIEAPVARIARLPQAIEEGARDLGAHAVSTTEQLAAYHRVENTYISTFQTLGGLGLLVGTIGLAAVLLRNVLERRRELALLAAVGYRTSHLFTIVLAENVLLLVWGLVIGTVCALVAVVPAIVDRGGWLPTSGGGVLLLGGVFAAGLLSSIVATRAALRTPLLSALRAE